MSPTRIGGWLRLFWRRGVPRGALCASLMLVPWERLSMSDRVGGCELPGSDRALVVGCAPPWLVRSVADLTRGSVSGNDGGYGDAGASGVLP